MLQVVSDIAGREPLQAVGDLDRTYMSAAGLQKTLSRHGVDMCKLQARNLRPKSPNDQRVKCLHFLRAIRHPWNK